jgi:hypothetical protein
MFGMLDNCGMNTENYSKILIGWTNFVFTNNGPYNITLGANGRTYNNINYGGIPYNNAVSARQDLVLPPEGANWRIIGDSQV